MKYISSSLQFLHPFHFFLSGEQALCEKVIWLSRSSHSPADRRMSSLSFKPSNDSFYKPTCTETSECWRFVLKLRQVCKLNAACNATHSYNYNCENFNRNGEIVQFTWVASVQMRSKNNIKDPEIFFMQQQPECEMVRFTCIYEPIYNSFLSCWFV